ncbi:MAG TPA: hypothetical protein VM802_14975 [Chitinophaga sp.]|uniref:hypothetical protein n=1 Tax=Chitinophaga sp. TaxID=1869181 RepID=UPI002C3C249B|nr:hypothetical protein [Chitinophaga sp.]HVI46176.1 hypothetical protein [Chitinophaga sp.]
MKNIVWGVFFVLIPIGAGAQQVNKITRLAVSRVKQFDTSGLRVVRVGSDEVEATNRKGDILRYRMDRKRNPIPYHCGIAYQLFEFRKGYITRITTFAVDGNMAGELESEGEAIMELEIKKKDLLDKQLARIDEEDGNLDPKDEDQQIVLARVYDDRKRLLAEHYISTGYYWELQHMMYRP